MTASLKNTQQVLMSWLSSVNTVTDYTTDCAIKESDSIPRQARDFSLLLSIHNGSGAHPVYAMGTWLTLLINIVAKA
jgi:hypothetical protein